MSDDDFDFVIEPTYTHQQLIDAFNNMKQRYSDVRYSKQFFDKAIEYVNKKQSTIDAVTIWNSIRNNLIKQTTISIPNKESLQVNDFININNENTNTTYVSSNINTNDIIHSNSNSTANNINDVIPIKHPVLHSNNNINNTSTAITQPSHNTLNHTISTPQQSVSISPTHHITQPTVNTTYNQQSVYSNTHQPQLQQHNVATLPQQSSPIISISSSNQPTATTIQSDYNLPLSYTYQQSQNNVYTDNHNNIYTQQHQLSPALSLQQQYQPQVPSYSATIPSASTLTSINTEPTISSYQLPIQQQQLLYNNINNNNIYDSNNNSNTAGLQLVQMSRSNPQQVYLVSNSIEIFDPTFILCDDISQKQRIYERVYNICKRYGNIIRIVYDDRIKHGHIQRLNVIYDSVEAVDKILDVRNDILTELNRPNGTISRSTSLLCKLNAISCPNKLTTCRYLHDTDIMNNINWLRPFDRNAAQSSNNLLYSSNSINSNNMINNRKRTYDSTTISNTYNTDLLTQQQVSSQPLPLVYIYNKNLQTLIQTTDKKHTEFATPMFDNRYTIRLRFNSVRYNSSECIQLKEYIKQYCIKNSLIVTSIRM